MTIPQSRMGLYGAPVGIIPPAVPPPVLTVSYELQCEGVPQQFPAVPQEQTLGIGNQGFGLAVTMLDAEGDPIDISNAVQVQLMLVWPGGQPQVIPAAFGSNGTDGVVAATVSAGLGGGYGLYHIYAFAVLRGQVLRTQAGRLWYTRGLQ